MKNMSVLRQTSTSIMSAAAAAVLLLLCLLLSDAAGAELAEPQNVHMDTLNTNYILRWDRDRSAAEGHAVTFTVEYVPRFKLRYKKKIVHWAVVCNRTSHMSCDLTKINLHYLSIYVVRVRAELDGRHSNWVQKEFCPDKDAVVGPPTRVTLSPAGSTLDVIIVEPLTSTNSSMKEVVRDLYYHIMYWEGSADQQALHVQVLSSSADLVTLPNLNAWTWYCVAVQSRVDFYNKSSSLTSPQCMRTEGPTPWWQILLYFLGSLLICFTVVLIVLFGFYRTYKTAKATFFPSNQLPAHFKEYLCDSPGSDIPRLLSPDSESELLCDKVIICPMPVLEIHHPPPEALPASPSGLEPENSGRHSRQDSGGSSDSGVYSTGGSSGLQQLIGTPGPAGAGTSWQGPFDSEQVKMNDMTTGFKSHLVITDEGVVDVCV